LFVKKIIFVTGGCRSGKSDYAQKKCEEFKGIKTYIATAIAFDKEMEERIKLHQSKRTGWNLIEEPLDIPRKLVELNGKTDVALLDCVTLWLNNLILKYNFNNDLITNNINDFTQSLKKIEYTLYIVSNEVGMGIVPENKLARFFRDLSGKTNQLIASLSDEFYVFFSGYSLRLK